MKLLCCWKSILGTKTFFQKLRNQLCLLSILIAGMEILKCLSKIHTYQIQCSPHVNFIISCSDSICHKFIWWWLFSLFFPHIIEKACLQMICDLNVQNLLKKFVFCSNLHTVRNLLGFCNTGISFSFDSELQELASVFQFKQKVVCILCETESGSHLIVFIAMSDGWLLASWNYC